MSELALGRTARELLPGFPEDIERLAIRLADYSDAAFTAVARLRSMDAGLWVGQAARSFSEQVGQLPAKLSRAAGAFQEAAFQLRAYAVALEEAQATANRAIDLFEEGERRSRARTLEQNPAELTAARNSIDSPPPPEAEGLDADPGELSLWRGRVQRAQRRPISSESRPDGTARAPG